MKDIKNYEGLYAVTEDGKVWSYRRNKYLAPAQNNSGYLYVDLSLKGKQERLYLHRIVAETYLDNPLNLPCVNHKNEIKTDNRLENLEFCTYSYNNSYGTKLDNVSKEVYCVELDRSFKSTREAARQLNTYNNHICDVCNGKRKTAEGYHWRYV